MKRLFLYLVHSILSHIPFKEKKRFIGDKFVQLKYKKCSRLCFGDKNEDTQM